MDFHTSKRDFAALSLARILITFFLLALPVLGQTLTYTTRNGTNNSTRHSTTVGNNTAYHDPCAGICKQKQSVGVLIGTFIGGAIVGALVTVVIVRYIHKKNSTPLPRDYGTPPPARFDVNRNNNDDQSARHEDEITLDDSTTKSHKKLERLIKPAVSPKPVNFGIPMAATPLIHCTDSSSLDDTTTGTSPENTTTTVLSPEAKPKPSKPAIALKPALPGKPKNIKSPEADDTPLYEIAISPFDNDDDDDGLEYSNLGSNSQLSQPYESLKIIPEDVEYTNQSSHIYEAIKDASY